MTLDQRIDAYAKVVGEFSDKGLPIRSQVRGDLKELEFWAERAGVSYTEVKDRYFARCRHYIDKGKEDYTDGLPFTD